MTPKYPTFLFEKGGTFWKNLLFLGNLTIFSKMFYFWTYVGIIDTVCSIFQYILFILHLFDAYFLVKKIFHKKVGHFGKIKKSQKKSGTFSESGTFWGETFWGHALYR